MMICSNCQTTNPDGARYCSECGAQLPTRCANCGHTNPPSAKFCNECGHRLGAESPPPTSQLPQTSTGERAAARNAQAMSGERRIVSILFCDVKGSTATAGKLDPEEWAEIMNGAFEQMIQPIHQYEGTVVRLLGDAVLAFFGAPIAREDDARRAVLAALEIQKAMGRYQIGVQRRWGVDFAVRCGINTGLVVFGAVGSELHQETTAMGDAVNLAARMEQTAQPGSVRITYETFRRVGPFFAVEDLGEITVKGKEAPVRVYRVLEEKSIPGRLRGIEGLEAQLIGREAEMAILREAAGDLARGNGAIIWLIGEAGLGKSRLIHELQGVSRAFETPITWFESASYSYEMVQPYGHFQRLMRNVFVIDGNESAHSVRKKIGAVLGQRAPSLNGQAQRVLERLLAIDSGSRQEPTLEGETFRGQLYVTMQRLWRLWALSQPAVLVFDDLHWADPASVALLEHLLVLSDETPILLIVAMREDRSAPAWALKTHVEQHLGHRYTEIKLQPLSASESDRLVNTLLAIADLPASLRQQILEKSAGNPFYVEEVVRSLIERGVVERDRDHNRWVAVHNVGEIQIPGSLQSLLMARIDSLEQGARYTVQLASVVGRSFDFRLLSRIAQIDPALLEQHLHLLQEAGLIQPAGHQPEQGYLFRHVLVQETAYGMILHRQRRQIHNLVGEALEALFPDKIEENAVVLAYHFDEAQQTAQALRYHRMAGDVAFRLYSVKEAIDHYGRALDLLHSAEVAGLDDSGDLLRHLYLRKGRALELDNQHDTALVTYEQMQNEAEQWGDRRTELAALAAQLPIYATPTTFVDPHKSQVLGGEALALARELDDRVTEAKILWNLSIAYVQDGQMEKGIDSGEQSVALARRLDLPEQLALALTDLALFCYPNSGQFDRAKEALAEADSIWRQSGNLPLLANNLSTLCTTLGETGEYAQAVAVSEEARQISVSINNLWGQAYSQYKVGNVYWDQGDPDRAIRAMEDCVHLGNQAGFLASQVETATDLAAIYGELGSQERSRPLARVAHATIDNQTIIDRSYGLSVLARLALIQNRQAEAEIALEKARTDPGRNVSVIFSTTFDQAEVELAIAHADSARALALSESLLGKLRQFGMRARLPRALYLQGQAYSGMGDAEAARTSWLEARNTATAIGSRWMLWQVLAALAGIEPDPVRARRLRQEAQAVVSHIAGNIGDVELRGSFLERADVKALLVSAG